VSLEPSLSEQELLAETFQREGSSLTAPELRAGLLANVGFFAAVLALLLTRPPGAFALAPAAISLVVLIAAMRVRFDTPFGFTVPIQLGFVPLLFSLPVSLVPVAVMIAIGVARLPDIVRGQAPVSRLLKVPVNSWFAIGPACVFAVANVAPEHASAVLLAGALVAQFSVDFAVSSLLYSTIRGATLASQLRETWVYGVDAALSGVALAVANDAHAHPAVALSLLPLLGLFALFAHERHHRLESLVELNNAYRGTALVLGDVVEADDGYTGLHSKGVVGLALDVADQMGLNAERRRNLEFAALLHDVGKIAIPKQIINKPGRLNPEEWTIIKTHSVEGQKMLERVGGFMREVGRIVRSHHERWDGGGYPDGLAGEAIPLEARIIGCCDSWNAMRTNRPYRNALSQEVAVAELLGNSGSQFDPHVVSALLAIVAPEVTPLEALPAEATPARAPARGQRQSAAASDRSANPRGGPRDRRAAVGRAAKH
jgi:putative nucleotidyltransferase with HDIG domain